MVTYTFKSMVISDLIAKHGSIMGGDTQQYAHRYLTNMRGRAINCTPGVRKLTLADWPIWGPVGAQEANHEAPGQ
jgi:hypothetical protein